MTSLSRLVGRHNSKAVRCFAIESVVTSSFSRPFAATGVNRTASHSYSTAQVYKNHIPPAHILHHPTDHIMSPTLATAIPTSRPLQSSYPYQAKPLPLPAKEYTFPNLAALEEPPVDSNSKPSLPSAQRYPEWVQNIPFDFSTHLVPAAYPRCSPDVSISPVPSPESASKAERNIHVEATADALDKFRDHYGRGHRNDKLLWLCLNRFSRKGTPVVGGLTLFFAHGTGFSKEMWEPIIRRLLTSPAGHNINEVWVWDAYNHGDSALVNEGKLDILVDWHDPARDLVNFLLHYMPSNSQAQLPTHLPRIHALEVEQRKQAGFSDRKLVTIGHSFGGTVTTLAAIDKSMLVDSLVLLDGAMVHPDDTINKAGLVTATLPRRDRWSSKDAALKQFSRSAFFQRWHPEVLRLYVEHGTFETPDGTVALKMSPLAEAMVYTNMPVTSAEAWIRLHRGELDENIELRWIVPAPGQPELCGTEVTQSRVWVRPENASNVFIQGGGHMVPLEKPDEVARQLSVFLQTKYGTGITLASL